MSEHEKRKAKLQDQLAETWRCKDPKCPSRHCYVLKEHGGIHIALTAKEYAIWVEAIVSELVLISYHAADALAL